MSYLLGRAVFLTYSNALPHGTPCTWAWHPVFKAARDNPWRVQTHTPGRQCLRESFSSGLGEAGVKAGAGDKPASDHALSARPAGRRLEGFRIRRQITFRRQGLGGGGGTRRLGTPVRKVVRHKPSLSGIQGRQCACPGAAHPGFARASAVRNARRRPAGRRPSMGIPPA